MYPGSTSAKWLFPQEKATFHNITQGHAYSGSALRLEPRVGSVCFHSSCHTGLEQRIQFLWANRLGKIAVHARRYTPILVALQGIRSERHNVMVGTGSFFALANQRGRRNPVE